MSAGTHIAPDASDAGLADLEEGLARAYDDVIVAATAYLDAAKLVRDLRARHADAYRVLDTENTKAFNAACDKADKLGRKHPTKPKLPRRPERISARAARSDEAGYKLRRLLERWRAEARLGEL